MSAASATVSLDHCLLTGASHSERGAHADAAACFADAVALAPTLLEVHLLCANAQRLAGDELGARATLRHAVRVATRPDVHAEYALGSALIAAGAGADAVPCFRRVRSLRPRDGAAAAALAAALREAGDLRGAQREIDAALKLDGRSTTALLTAARIQHDLGALDRALHCCHRALGLQPDSRSALLTRSYVHHLLGRRADGFRDFEARVLPVPPDGMTRWDGDSLRGRSLLIVGEQGVGDQVQFLRFTRHPRIQDAREVIVSCQPELVSLLRAHGVAAVPRGDEPVCDTWVPLLSLPLLLEAFEDAALTCAPYLRSDGARAAAAPLADCIGLVWAGNPLHHNDAVRSMPAAVMQQLVDRHPAQPFVTLQHGAAAADVTAPHVIHHAVTSWDETARVLSQLALLITVDTGIAHLAGAMGVPVWLLIPQVPDWRWGMRGETTPWYGSMRVFRQTTRGDWAGVAQQVSRALDAASPG
jgi:tetratricopeptide (TPR) repeat protein